MKRSFFISAVILLFSAVLINAQNFSVKPAKPQPGEKIEIVFTPENTPLSNAEKVELFAYTYAKELSDTRNFEMKKSGANWTASFKTDKNDLGVLIVFRNGDLQADNNKKGYVIHLYDKKGNVLPGSMAGLGNGYFSWMSYYVGFDRDLQLASELMTKDFEKNPSIKKDWVKYYVPVFSTMQKEKSLEIINEGISAIEQKKDLTEDDYNILYEYSKRAKDEERTQKYEKIALEKFPSGMIAQMKEYEVINNIPDVDAKITAVEKFGEKYPESRYLPGLQNQIIKSFVGQKQYDKLKNFMVSNKETIHPYYFANNAGTLIKDSSYNFAYDIAAAGEDAFASMIKKEKKPEYLSETQWKESNDELKAQVLSAKGRALYFLDRKKEALDVLDNAEKLSGYKDPELNEFYVKALLDEGQYDEAFDQASRFIREGNSTDEISALLETAYEKVKGNKNGFNVFLSGLEKEANLKLAEQLKHEMINEPAPQFKLVDLKGNEVSLQDYKGKVVLVDFWATWCGPCLSSFPGMQKAVEKYSGNENVKFLFVNSWERVENKKQNAEDFIAKNKYPFQVLLDLDNKVIESYKVSGIPTKFIIDKEGNIRFKSVGYNGSLDKMVAEISAMISMLE